jgi:hypothetical protein
VAHDDLQWDTLRVETNRARVGRDGTVYPAVTYERNRLRYDTQANHSLADWFADPATGTIELRLGWGMLHVLDPSSRLVLRGMDTGGGPAGVTTDAFNFVVASYDPANPAVGGTRLGCGTGTEPFRYQWRPWEVPAWHQELKPLFDSMRTTLRDLSPVPPGPAR